MNANEDHLTHSHLFLGADHARNERRIWLVIGVTAAMMIVEIVAGTIYGSMALTADGWHMSTHASALMISALAYLYARRHADNPRFTFGTGKLGDLAGFSSAIILALIALFIAGESVMRLSHPVPIDFEQAILVAVIGLIVNLVSAWLLKDAPHGHHHSAHSHHDHAHHDHHHDHEHSRDHGTHQHHDHAAPHGHADNNLRSAYMHVLADAMTSALAILALAFGSLYGWLWLDPLMGIVGGAVIAHWCWGLMKSAGMVLLDVVPTRENLPQEIREAIETSADRITDLHVWQVGPGHHAAIVALVTPEPKAPAFYKRKLEGLDELSHVTIEVTDASKAA